jgi:hypothetical protein
MKSRNNNITEKAETQSFKGIFQPFELGGETRLLSGFTFITGQTNRPDEFQQQTFYIEIEGLTYLEPSIDYVLLFLESCTKKDNS